MLIHSNINNIEVEKRRAGYYSRVKYIVARTIHGSGKGGGEGGVGGGDKNEL